MTNIEIKEVFAWVKDGASSVSITQVGNWIEKGYTKKSQGFRIVKNGQTLFGSSLPFKSKEEALHKLSTI